MLHRKGVEIARKTLDYHWLFPLPPDNRAEPDFVWYPSNQDEQRTVDLEINTSDRFRPWGVEVVTEREDLKAVAEKWGKLASIDRRIVWLFENRVHACEVLNALSEHGELEFRNGPIRNPENWAVRNLNRRFWQATTSHELANADTLHTVTGMLEASQDEIKSYFRDFKDYER